MPCGFLSYAGAIANFYYLTQALEEALDEARDDIMVSQVLEMGLRLVPGYEADLGMFSSVVSVG